MAELSALNDIVASLDSVNASLFAISPQTRDSNRAVEQQANLKFRILSDAHNAYAKLLDLVHGFPEELKELYLSFGADLAAANGDASWELPLATRIVVGKDHRVKAIQTNADYAQRPDPSESLGVVQGLLSSQVPHSG